MNLLMRVAGVILVVVGMLGFAGSFDLNEKGHRPLELLPIFAVMIGGGVYLFVRARKQSKHDETISLEQKLLALAQGTGGVLTVAHVVAALSVTADEAKAALTQLSRDGLAEFDVDAEGAPIYRVRKLPPPK